MIENDTIAAVASGVGGAVTLIRVSGGGAIAAGDRIFRGGCGRRLADARGVRSFTGRSATAKRLSTKCWFRYSALRTPIPARI